MASKKPAVSRSAKPAPKLVPKSEQKPAPQPAAAKPATGMKVWTLPIVMLMLVAGAAALLMAVREASNAPQAAPMTMAPDTRASVAAGGTGSRAAVASSAVPAAARAADPPPPKPVDTPSADSPKPVSLTGCLQQTDRGFVLKNTEGADAPKSRSWKSGFLKRSAVSIELSDKGGSTGLGKHVGQRVRVTGALVERDMKVLSLRPISASCE